ncbi:MAG: hypothetical protein ACRDTA_02335 [Pseudonocardiaceae bacterium]
MAVITAAGGDVEAGSLPASPATPTGAGGRFDPTYTGFMGLRRQPANQDPAKVRRY